MLAEFARLETQPERLDGTKPAFEHACRVTTVVILLQLLDPPADWMMQVAVVAGSVRLEQPERLEGR